LLFWKCTAFENSKFIKNQDLLDEVSLNLIEHFKKEIVNVKNPTTYGGYVNCTHVEKSRGNILIVLDSRVEIIIHPIVEVGKIYFVSCDEI